MELEEPPGAQDLDMMIAKWGSWKHSVPSCTVAQHRARFGHAVQKKPSMLEKKTPATTKKKVRWEPAGWFVRSKHERGSTLVWLGHEGSRNKQLCQLNAERFDSVDVAVTIMSELGEAMANGGANAYEERSRVLEKRGVTISKGKRGGAFKSQGHKSDAGIARVAAPTEPAPATPPRKVRKMDFDLFMPMTVDIPDGTTEAFMDC